MFVRVDTPVKPGFDKAFRATFTQMIVDFLSLESGITMKESYDLTDAPKGVDAQRHVMDYVDPDDGRTYVWRGSTHVRVHDTTIQGISCIDVTGVRGRCERFAPQLFERLPDIHYADITPPLQIAGVDVVIPKDCVSTVSSISCDSNIQIVWDHRDPESPKVYMQFADVMVDAMRKFISTTDLKITEEVDTRYDCELQNHPAKCRRRVVVTNDGTINVLDAIGEVREHGVAFICSWPTPGTATDAPVPQACETFVRLPGSLPPDVH